MQSIERDKFYVIGERILFAGFFLAAWLLCGLISYTDGDDAYFSSMARSMPLWEYLKMRYVGWEGRMTSETMTYLAFYFGKSFWQPVNAFLFTMLPGGLIHLVKKLSGERTPKQSFFMALLIYVMILSLGIEVIGYGAFWITGSTFYLWSIVAGIWSVMPYADLVYQRGNAGRLSFLYAIPCGLIAAMGQEQIAAVVIAFAVLAVWYEIYCSRRIPILHLAEIIIMAAALFVLFISPGTEARTQTEIMRFMPQYETMSTGNHIFITIQWVLSSFANEGKQLFFLIWIFGLILMLQKKDNRGKVFAVLAGIEAVAALLPFLGVTLCSEMGTGVTDFNQCITQVATPSSLTGQNWLAVLWWLVAVAFTLALLWRLGEKRLEKLQLTLLLLAACASEGIMYFSPTMYASGARVYFVAQILLWFLAGLLGAKLLRQGKVQILILAGAVGVLNVACSITTVASYL
ncbi:MAG: hypothetical protein HFI76_10060 [Lachnospiraceae bacterium]|nr:hypothetical protein [Lachnospiraceae bacterium]